MLLHVPGNADAANINKSLQSTSNSIFNSSVSLPAGFLVIFNTVNLQNTLNAKQD